MALLEKQLVVKDSILPNAGKGLFTDIFIPKGSLIIEYKGKITTWKEVSKKDFSNPYIYYVTSHHVIDAKRSTSALAKYANDANGLSKVKGITNNSEYIEVKKKVYIKAKKDIPVGSEILVSYGKEYWDTIKHNIKIDKINKG